MNRAEFTQTLVKFREAWRLYINGPMLRSPGLSVGDEAKIDIEFDREPREVEMPSPFEQALAADANARAAFEKLSTS